MAEVSKQVPTGASVSSLEAALEAQKYLESRLGTITDAPSFRSIPIIDLTKTFTTSLADKQVVALEINEACTKVGFFYIIGHGVPDDVCDSVLRLARRFFHELPQESKEELHMKKNEYFRGYEPADSSSVNGFASQETKEAFNWGYESGLDPTGGDGKYVELDGKPEFAVNLWPKESELPGFYKGIATYYGHASPAFQDLIASSSNS